MRSFWYLSAAQIFPWDVDDGGDDIYSILNNPSQYVVSVLDPYTVSTHTLELMKAVTKARSAIVHSYIRHVNRWLYIRLLWSHAPMPHLGTLKNSEVGHRITQWDGFPRASSRVVAGCAKAIV